MITAVEAAQAPRTEAGKRLLARESYNARSFALITVEAIRAIEDEARASVTDEEMAMALTSKPGLTLVPDDYLKDLQVMAFRDGRGPE